MASALALTLGTLALALGPLALVSSLVRSALRLGSLLGSLPGSGLPRGDVRPRPARAAPPLALVPAPVVVPGVLVIVAPGVIRVVAAPAAAPRAVRDVAGAAVGPARAPARAQALAAAPAAAPAAARPLARTLPVRRGLPLRARGRGLGLERRRGADGIPRGIVFAALPRSRLLRLGRRARPGETLRRTGALPAAARPGPGGPVGALLPAADGPRLGGAGLLGQLALRLEDAVELHELELELVLLPKHHLAHEPVRVLAEDGARLAASPARAPHGGRAGHRVHQVAYAASARARTRGGRSRTAADAVRTRTRRIRTLIGTRGIRGTLIGTRRIRRTLIGTIAGTERRVVEPPTILGRRRRLRLRRLRRLVRARGRAVGALARVRRILGPHALLDVHEEPRVREVPTRAGAEDVPAAGRHLNVRVGSRGPRAHPGAASRAGEENRRRGHARGVVVVVVGELRERGAQRPARAREMLNRARRRGGAHLLRRNSPRARRSAAGRRRLRGGGRSSRGGPPGVGGDRGSRGSRSRSRSRGRSHLSRGRGRVGGDERRRRARGGRARSAVLVVGGRVRRRVGRRRVRERHRARASREGSEPEPSRKGRGGGRGGGGETRRGGVGSGPASSAFVGRTGREGSNRWKRAVKEKRRRRCTMRREVRRGGRDFPGSGADSGTRRGSGRDAASGRVRGARRTSCFASFARCARSFAGALARSFPALACVVRVGWGRA